MQAIIGYTVGMDKQLQDSQLENFTPINDVSELQITDVVVGDGAEVAVGATVTAHYTGAICQTGVIFQSSHDGPGQPATFPLNAVIEGWQKGVPGMKVGGTRRLIIPASMAYGAQSPAPNIPANSNLVFDIELKNIA